MESKLNMRKQDEYFNYLFSSLFSENFKEFYTEIKCNINWALS